MTTPNQPVEIVESETIYTAEIERHLYVWQLPKAIGDGYRVLFAKTKPDEENVPYVRYTDIDWKRDLHKSALAMLWDGLTRKMHVYVGMTTASLQDPTDNIITQTTTPQRHLRTTHFGAYSKVGESYKRIMSYAKDHHLEVQNQCIEYYMNDPHTVSEAEIETIVLVPIK